MTSKQPTAETATLIFEVRLSVNVAEWVETYGVTPEQAHRDILDALDDHKMEDLVRASWRAADEVSGTVQVQLTGQYARNEHGVTPFRA